MSYYSDNKIAGLEVVGTVEEEDLSYEFNTFAVVKDEEGRFFYVTDSGCSCPTPFEDTDKEDLKRVTSRRELREAIKAWTAPPVYPNGTKGSGTKVDMEDVTALLDKTFPK